MMLKKDFTKKLSALLAAAMLLSCSFNVFAENTDVTPVTEGEQTETTTPPVGDEEQGGQTPGDTDDTAPAPTPISIRAVYTMGETAGTYKVVFTSATTLPEIKNINFTLSTKTEGATIDKYSFGDLAGKTDPDAGISSNMAKTQLTFTKGAFSASVSGTPVLCDIELTSSAEPSADNIEITAFFAYKNDVKVDYAPTLEVIKQPVMSAAADKVYNDLCALPKADELSFYEEDGKTLADITGFSTEISAVKDAYGKLSADEKKSIQDTFDFYSLTMPSVETLEKLVSDMAKVSEVMELLNDLNDIEADELLNHRFLTNVYKTKIALSADDESKLTFASTSALKNQYEKAKTDINTIASDIEKAYSDLGVDSDGFSDKIELLDTQLEIIQKLSSDKYYENYLDDLELQADNILTELEDYDNETFKDTLVDRVENCKKKIEVVQDGISAMPEVEFPSQIKRGSQYVLTIRRGKSNAVKAKIRIDVYNKGTKDNKLDTKTFDFNSGATALECELRASSKVYPLDKNVDVYVTYIVEGAEFPVESKSIYCRYVNNLSSNTGVPSGGSSSSSDRPSGGTIFPDTDKDNDKENNKENNKDDEDDVLFSDIEKYDWAKEAIEGLYYVGIVNGMEEGIFNPAGNVTREQFCKMVVQLFGVLNNNETETDFVDVDENAWYTPYISSSIRAGYVQGQSDEYFGIGESIMRQDMATILYRAIGEQNTRAVLDFSDSSDIAPYAEDAISELVGLDVLSGYEDGTFKPRGTATRAEAAKVIWGIYNIIND